MILPWLNTIKAYVEAIITGRIDFTKSSIGCKACGRDQSFIRWGYYKRKVIDIRKVYEIVVQRFRCLICGKTFSALPSFVGRRERFSRGLLGTILRHMLDKTLGPYGIVEDQQLAQEAPSLCDRLHPRTLSRFVRRLEQKAEGLIAELMSICSSLDGELDPQRATESCPSARPLERLWAYCGLLEKLIEKRRPIDTGLNRLELAAAVLARGSKKDMLL